MVKSIKKIKTKMATALFKLKKNVYQNYFSSNYSDKDILLIIGCQRSGTSLMLKVFDNDLKVKIYGEFSELSSGDHNNIRLNPFPKVQETIEKNRVPNIVMKPLVETQNSVKLLEYFSNSKALWMFRHYKDVASSSIVRFGVDNGINNLYYIIKNDGQNWRSEGVSKNTRKLITRYFSKSMSPNDAEALFWYIRNALFFELKLYQEPRVKLCKYEDFVLSPLEKMKSIYSFSGFQFPRKSITSSVHAKSVHKGNSLELSPDIDDLCSDMWTKLNNYYKERKESIAA